MSIKAILAKPELSLSDLITLVSISDPEEYLLLEAKADKIQKAIFNDTVYYRGLIEFSNICIKDCLYCGIRKSNTDFERYTMTKEEILFAAKWNYDNQYGSITLQSAERTDEDFVDFVEDILKEIKKLSHNQLGITLCCGEQTKEVYERWYKAGADRYLLRIETSNPSLYSTIHPNDNLHSHAHRVECLKILKEIGCQVGTGVMIGFPGQTEEDLAKDILFFKEIGAHMIGMGPYIVHSDTPLASIADNSPEAISRRFQLGLNMIATTRIFMPKANIAATTALQALDPLGREKGVAAGANILMPITTNKEHRAKYQLYDNKPCVEDTSDDCKKCLAARMLFSNKKIGFSLKGDSPLYTQN